MPSQNEINYKAPPQRYKSQKNWMVTCSVSIKKFLGTQQDHATIITRLLNVYI